MKSDLKSKYYAMRSCRSDVREQWPELKSDSSIYILKSGNFTKSKILKYTSRIWTVDTPASTLDNLCALK